MITTFAYVALKKELDARLEEKRNETSKKNTQQEKSDKSTKLMKKQYK